MTSLKHTKNLLPKSIKYFLTSLILRSFQEESKTSWKLWKLTSSLCTKLSSTKNYLSPMQTSTSSMWKVIFKLKTVTKLDSIHTWQDVLSSECSTFYTTSRSKLLFLVRLQNWILFCTQDFQDKFHWLDLSLHPKPRSMETESSSLRDRKRIMNGKRLERPWVYLELWTYQKIMEKHTMCLTLSRKWR